MTPLLLMGLAVIVPVKCGLVNLGAEGQLHIGAIVTAVVALTLNLTSSILAVLSVPLLSFLLGGIWAFIPGMLKAKMKIK
jgi:simple sugar transport system permease protein